MIGTSTGKLAVLGGVLLVMTCLAACGSGANPGSNTSAAAGPGATPQLVSPKSVRGSEGSGSEGSGSEGSGSEGSGSEGKGPVVISNPARLPGGKASSQKVILSDRTLTITSVTSEGGANQSGILIDLDLVVRNTGGRAIQNKAAFFDLIGAEGDTFGNQSNDSSDNFYGTIGAHASRSGTIEFRIPSAAASSLFLLYRPEIAKETVLTLLKIG